MAMTFPSSYDIPEADHTPYGADEDDDPRDDAFPFMDEDGTQVIDPRDVEVAPTPKPYVPAPSRTTETERDHDNEDGILNLRGRW